MGDDRHDDDRTLFRRAMRGVRPIAAKGTPGPAAPRPRGGPLPADRTASGQRPVVPGAYTPASGDATQWASPGLQRGLLRRLRSGRLPVDAELDLHGMTLPAAERALGSFLSQAAARGQRHLRVVHGSGTRSPAGRAVLRPAVRGWLSAHPAVLAWGEAHPRQGGAGATWVWLRRR